MDTNKTLVIAPFGLSSYEIRVLQTICQLSKTRARTYELGEPDTIQPLDFAIVDQEDADALAAWRRIQTRNPLLPVITLSKRPAKNPSVYQLGRPIMPTRLLEILDEIKLSNERPAFIMPEVDEELLTSEDYEAGTARTPVNARGSQLSALVVDDNLPVRQQIEYELAPFVGRVDSAEDGEQALELMTRKQYDIVILDVMLPGMDGYKVCRKIKSDKKTENTAVVMLTAKTSRLDRVRGRLAGCDTYLTKPVDYAQFIAAVQKHLYQDETESFGGTDMLNLSVTEQT